ncbi:hypothetical protein [Chryseobacterium oryctis]|uniref:Uncharacterized protein n=1 Tax=Chryseobacterium oryctis TaxID=2952618 RepID=A0ABT3HJA5_9FLAO|nr:hypothetical protein [Chryseobacterium oryctis]MCW3159862.1 hypothetical protein [Chryseobacterium oryctis]
MKKIGLYIVLLASFSLTKISAQVNSNQLVANNIADSNAFFDASTNFNTSASSSNSMGKGLVFPNTDLSLFRFDLTLADGITFPSYFDGMLVYNTKNGGSTADPAITTQTANLVPGWYYFSNPNGEANGSVSEGRWLPVGGASPKVDVKTTETVTNTLVNGAQVYAIKGSFVANGTSTTVSIPSPTGMTSMYGITIYKTSGTGNKVVYSRDLYSYNVGATNNAVTGSPSISVVYPADTYDYVLEYLK